jgi:hypothetical protein
MMEAHHARPGLHRYVSGSRRFLLHSLAFHLHITRDPANDADGLTLKGLRAACASLGLASPGMAHLYLQMLHANRMLVVAGTTDRRFRRFEPTDKMISQVRDQTRANLVPVNILFPEIEALRRFDSDPKFMFAVRRAMGKVFSEGENPVRHYQEINYFGEMASGHMVLLELMATSAGPHPAPQPRPTRIDLAACAEFCAVSRVHVAKIFAGAARRGLLVMEGPGGSAIRPTELLIDRFLEWSATQFLFFAHCAVEAIEDRNLHRKDAYPPKGVFDLANSQ